MITVSTKTYKEIEDALEDHWNTLPWKRIWNNGKKGGYDEVIKRFDLKCYEEGNGKVGVMLVSKSDGEHVVFDKVFDTLV